MFYHVKILPNAIVDKLLQFYKILNFQKAFILSHIVAIDITILLHKNTDNNVNRDEIAFYLQKGEINCAITESHKH